MEEGEEELPGGEDGEEGDPELVGSSSSCCWILLEEFLQTERDTFLSRNEKMSGAEWHHKTSVSRFAGTVFLCLASMESPQQLSGRS